MFGMANPALDYHNLTVSERLRLAGEIWDSIAADAGASPGAFPLSDAQKAELDRRIEAYDADPSHGVPIDDSPTRIRAQIRRPA